MSGFNFRLTPAYVTDGVGNTYVEEVDSYPVTRGGLTFGYESVASVAGRNRNAGIDARLAGLHQITNSGGYTLFSTDSGSGTFDIELAIGDASFGSGPLYVEVVEINSSQVVQSVLDTVVSNVSNGTGEWYDATGVNRTSATDWVNNNATLQVTVASGNSLGLRLGDPAGLASGQTKVAHFSYESVAPTYSIVNVDTDNIVVDGQQDVTLTTTGFGSDITSVNLKVGSDTLALTGLTGTGDNYTFDMNDVTSYTGSTAGLPLSSATYQNEIEVTDGTDTATINITRNPKAGYAVVETVSAVDTTGSIFETRVGGAPSDGSQIYYPTADNTAISAAGIITTDSTGFTAFVWDVTSKTWDVVTFVAGEGIPSGSRITWNAVGEYLRTQGYSGGNNDVIVDWLIDLGYDGAFNDMWYKYWESLGYTGSFNDKRYKWLKS